MTLLRDLGEDRLLARWLPNLAQNNDVVVAAGDDCAVVRVRGSRNLLLLKTDCVVEDVHFTKQAGPADLGWKAMARALSDFAAMSGLPRFALITLVVPPRTRVRWTDELYRGLNAAARRFEVAIVGGETSSTSAATTITVALVGEVERQRCITRSGGKAGDELFVTGRLGGSIARRHLRFVPRIEESRWLTAHFRLHAMIDLSDGLGADLPRLARASGLGFELNENAVPRNRGCTLEQAINDGEDYELLFAIGRKQAAGLEREWAKQFPKLPLTRIGQLIRKSRIENRESLRGYEHFKERR